jgi:transposase-like protein
MKRKLHKPEQIIRMLCIAEAELSGRRTSGEVCQRLGISEQTFYRWRKAFGSMNVNEVRRLRELEIETMRLKKLVTEQALDQVILKEVAEGNS